MIRSWSKMMRPLDSPRPIGGNSQGDRRAWLEKQMEPEPIIDAIGGIVPLETLGNALKQRVHSAFAELGESGDTLRRLLKGEWLGHPLHPPIASVPIGAWSTAAVLDLCGAAAAADIAIAFGLSAAAVAIASGLTDYSESGAPVTRIGAAHAVCNLTGTALYVASLFARRSGHRGAGIALSLAGLGAVGAGGYLGGEIVFKTPASNGAAEPPPGT
jgi:uncharacterized membrane protein